MVYFDRFLDQFPSISILADAPIDDVLKAWEGLGYNSRARNLHKAALMVMSDFGGVFPTEFDQVISLPGIGDYTASAICAFAYGQPTVAVDTNVERWCSRYLGIKGYKSSPALRKDVKTYLAPFVQSHDSPKTCNQAFINFGALICKARLPLCTECPISDSCYALSKEQIDIYPRVKPKKPRKQRRFSYYVCIAGDHVLIHHRTEKDIWQGMYEFPQIELIDQEFTEIIPPPFSKYLADLDRVSVSNYKQVLTHQVINAEFQVYFLEEPFESKYQWIPSNQLSDIPLSGVVRLFLAGNMHIFNR